MITRIRTYAYDINYDGQRQLTVIDTVKEEGTIIFHAIRLRRFYFSMRWMRRLIKVLQLVTNDLTIEIDQNGWTAILITRHTVSSCLSVSTKLNNLSSSTANKREIGDGC